MIRSLVVDHFLDRARQAIQKSDPTILALLARNFFLHALDKGAPDELISRWLFFVNSTGDKLTKEELRMMYFEAVAHALEMTNGAAHEAIREAKEKLV